MIFHILLHALYGLWEYWNQYDNNYVIIEMFLIIRMIIMRYWRFEYCLRKIFLFFRINFPECVKYFFIPYLPRRDDFILFPFLHPLRWKFKEFLYKSLIQFLSSSLSSDNKTKRFQLPTCVKNVKKKIPLRLKIHFVYTSKTFL